MSEMEMITVEGRLRELKQEKETLQIRMSEINRLISAFQVVLNDCASKEEVPTYEKKSLTDQFMDESLEHILIQLAEKNGGELNSYDIRPKLVEEGILRGDSRAGSAKLYEAFCESDHFEPAGKRGRWRLSRYNTVQSEENGGIL